MFLARKAIQSKVPIVRSDTDISGILERSDRSINNILDMFIASNVSLHLLRAIEPNLRFGAAIRTHLTHTKNIPACPHWNSEQSKRCIHLASRKQIGDALVKYEDRVVNRTWEPYICLLIVDILTYILPFLFYWRKTIISK